MTIEDIISDELEALRIGLIERMRANNLIATGKTARSLNWSAHESTGELRGARWFATLEKGRGKWQGGKEDPQFLTRLIEWIRARGMTFNSEAQLVRFAKYLKWKINKSGTALYRRGGRKDIYTPEFLAFADRLRKRAGDGIKIELARGL